MAVASLGSAGVAGSVVNVAAVAVASADSWYHSSRLKSHSLRQAVCEAVCPAVRDGQRNH